MNSPTAGLTSALSDRYRIERELGAGGMATVYLAEDLKHDRKVAIKVLKPELAAVLGAERFVVEIKTTAALSHPHILPLFDSGKAAGRQGGSEFLYYVMPYIQGETIREKLNRETQFGIEEAVRITTEVADALDYAHRQGVIHRDIKPENILLHDGRPMVMDFGIALAVSAAAGGRMTETGLSLGTPHYMSPEQATADKQITARSDIYSLAGVLYEMLTGEPPHTGSSAQAIIMKIVTDTPRPVAELRKSVPPNVAAALARALEKLPADRFDSAKSFADALSNPQFGHAIAGRHAASSFGSGTTSRTRVGSLLGWGVGAVGLALSVWALQSRAPASGESPATQHLNITLPDSAPLSFAGSGSIGVGRRALALSPDGRILVYTAVERGVDRIYRRNIGDFEATVVTGTEGAYDPMVSPDGQWIAFFVGAELRKVPIGGGAAVALASIPEASGADWAPDGRILVAAREGQELGWVPPSGGPLALIPSPQGVTRVFPKLLPDGRYALIETINPWASSVVGVVDLETGRTVALSPSGPVSADSLDPATAISGQQPQYLASGQLIYTTPAGLMAVAFDPVTHRVSGSAVEVLSGVRSVSGGTQYVVAVDGTMVYAPGADADRGALVWVSRDGVVDSLGFAPQRYGTFSLSPDGRRLAALVMASTGRPELWVYDLDGGAETKVLTRGVPSRPRWWPDGRRVVFSEIAPRAPYPHVTVRQLVESAGERDTLGVGWHINDIAPDTLEAAGSQASDAGAWIVPLVPGKDPVPLDSFPGAWGPEYSPDQRWIAYTSNEAGQYEIYVTAAGQRGARRKVSLAGGEEPVWSPRGDELYYRWGREWFAVAVPPPGSSTFGRPRAIFRGPYVNVYSRSHDISPDGRRHLLILGPREESTTRLNVITNWTDDVRRKVER